MISKYVVVQYLPRPLSGERINVGVIAWSQGRIFTRFLSDWRRVRAFGREDIEFLRDFAQQVEDLASEPALPGLGLDAGRLEGIVGSWINSIQFSQTGSSLKSPEQVLMEVAPVFLPKLPLRVRRDRSRRSAATLAARKVLAALTALKGKVAGELMKRNLPIRGELDEHEFDVVVSNGKPLLGAQGLSFELRDTRSLRKDIDATAWAVDDVKRCQPTLPLAVLALPPKRESRTFERAKKVFAGLGAAVVLEGELDAWVERIVAPAIDKP